MTPNRVRQLRDEGVLAEKAPELYELKASVVRYIDYLRKGRGNASLNEERAMLTRAKREAVDMENEERRRNLHSAEEVENGIKTMCLNIRSRLLSLPAKLAPRLSEMDGDRAGIFDELKRAVDEALEKLSDYNIAMALTDEEEDESGF